MKGVVMTLESAPALPQEGRLYKCHVQSLAPFAFAVAYNDCLSMSHGGLARPLQLSRAVCQDCVISPPSVVVSVKFQNDSVSGFQPFHYQLCD
jgi:hypothetical protein